MKKAKGTTIVLLFIAVAFFASCKENTPAEKVLNAEDKVVQANKDLDEANAQYLIDIQNYRVQTSAEITANEQSIAAFKLRIINQKAEAKADYEKKITELEQKNTDMRRKMDEYQASGKDNWENFKTEFSHDMSALGQAFKDLTVNNSN
ncbi:MAG: hypothetical protein CO119_10460 [Flavobacteriales bacterium CG_4_9_14_3_um_filter_40_17]|nr:MAG: hypothetical protein CO119_10460 [Flavobacteriales bacterium CG_4_9_14_3_um_filter_40_17]